MQHAFSIIRIHEAHEFRILQRVEQQLCHARLILLRCYVHHVIPAALLQHTHTQNHVKVTAVFTNTLDNFSLCSTINHVTFTLIILIFVKVIFFLLILYLLLSSLLKFLFKHAPGPCYEPIGCECNWLRLNSLLFTKPQVKLHVKFRCDFRHTVLVEPNGENSKNLSRKKENCKPCTN